MFADSKGHKPPRKRSTLLGRILMWMIVPLFVLWSVGIVITYFISLNIANSPYDRTLANHLRLLRHEAELHSFKHGFTLSDTAQSVFAGQADETPILWQILDANGHVLAGEKLLRIPENWSYDIDQVRFRNTTINHTALRIAYEWGGRDQDGRGFLAVVAEPAEARATLQQEILTGMLTPQLIILPLAAMLAGLGLTQGLEPLSILQEHMRKRKSSDLSPIRDDLAPAEIVPLIAAMNNVLKRLSDSLESQRRFVANAAHQLKTPLAGIRTQCELALRTENQDNIKKSMQQLIIGSERATRLVNQLLLLARAESFDPNLAQTSQPLDLYSLAESCTLDWVQTALTRNIDLGFEASTEELPIFGNSIMLRELINNLIDNALLYTPSGGQVTVRAYNDADQVCLEVQDNGPGIPADERERVFDRFYRILGRNAEGSGLGLAIVKEVAEHHQAEICFLPPGNHLDHNSAGTRICICFPRRNTTRTRI